MIASNTALTKITYAAKGSEEEENEEVDLTKKGKADISNRERIKVEGEIFGSGLKVQSSLKTLIRDIDDSLVFSDVKLIKSDALPEGKYNSSGISFEIYLFPAPGNSA